jgi:hypothetical protein
MKLRLSGAVELSMDHNVLLVGTRTACLIAAVLVLLADAASAQSSGRGGADVRAIRGGYCPQGTCNIHGGRRANNLAKCAASNCRG